MADCNDVKGNRQPNNPASHEPDPGDRFGFFCRQIGSFLAQLDTPVRNPNLSLCLHQARLSIIAFLGAIGLLLCGCSTDVAATSLREQMAAGQPQPAVTLTQSAVSVDLPHGYSCDDLHLGSRWTQVGTIPEGDVYQDVDGKYQVRTGVSYYQADLVVKENSLVGIYLPSQSAFVGTNSSPSLHWK